MRYKSVVYGISVLVVLLLGIYFYFREQNSPKKYYRDDFSTHFKVRYLEQLETKVPEVVSHDITMDEFYKNNKENINLLSKIYGELIAKKYMAPVYVAYVSPELGYGLFADCALQKGEMIGEYTGILVKESETSDTNKYLFNYPSMVMQGVQCPGSLCVDAECAGNYTRFANHREFPNAERRYVPYNGLWHVIFIAIQDIVKDEQIFINYGSEYWGEEKPLEITD